MGGQPTRRRGGSVRSVLVAAAFVCALLWTASMLFGSWEVGDIVNRPVPQKPVARPQTAAPVADEIGAAIESTLAYTLELKIMEEDSGGEKPTDAPETTTTTTTTTTAQPPFTGTAAPRPPASYRTCAPQSAPQFRVADNGLPCVLPFKLNNTWHHTCALGQCATRIDVLGRAVQLFSCTRPQLLGVSCRQATNEEGIAVSCEEPLGRGGQGGTCVCTNGIVRRLTDFEGAQSCSAFCWRLSTDAMSSAHSAQQIPTSPEIVTQLAELAKKHAPVKTETDPDLGRWQKFHAALEDVKPGNWCGRGIAIMAGSVSTLPQALATVSYLRGHFGSNVPVEVWRTEDEASEFSEDFRTGLTQLKVTIRTLPAAAESASTSEMFALKPAVVLASSFDEVLLLDADSLPLVDPDELFQLRDPKTSGLFWPDFWTLLWDAHIWDAIGGWPFGSQRHVPSQDSGLMVVCKSCGGWKPLALAFYFNYHSQPYYNAIYYGHYQEKKCPRSSSQCQYGHDVPGMGDKDTFQIAWMALKEPFEMMPPASIAGVLLPKRTRFVCGASFIHRDKSRKAVALHHNSNKWWWKDFAEGRWTSWRTGLLLTHVTSFTNDSAAYFADGMNDWRSITYSQRSDAGRQQPPPSSRWCIVYKGATTTRLLTKDLGWDAEKVLARYYTAVYAAPWVMKWATLSSGPAALAPCVRAARIQDEAWMEHASDEDIRNTVISALEQAKVGEVSILQSHSDILLAKLCTTHLVPASKSLGPSRKEEASSSPSQ